MENETLTYLIIGFICGVSISHIGLCNGTNMSGNSANDTVAVSTAAETISTTAAGFAAVENRQCEINESIQRLIDQIDQCTE